MTSSSLACLLLCATMSAAPTAADLQHLQSVFVRILQSTDDSQIPKPELVVGEEMEAGVKALKLSEFQTLLPLAKRCWESKRLEVRVAGVDLLLLITARPDSAIILEPAIDEMAKLLSSPEIRIRKGVLYTLAVEQPGPSDKAVELLAKHMTNPTASTGEILMVAGTLLDPVHANAGNVHLVLTTVRAREDAGLTGHILNLVGQQRILEPEALDFLRENVAERNPELRKEALDSVLRMSPAVRKEFLSELQRVASDPAESPKIRALAAQALSSK